MTYVLYDIRTYVYTYMYLSYTYVIFVCTCNNPIHQYISETLSYIYWYWYIYMYASIRSIILHLWNALSLIYKNLYLYICEYEWHVYMYAKIRLIITYVRCSLAYIHIDICTCMQESDLSIHMWDALSHMYENLYSYICDYESYIYIYARVKIIDTNVRCSLACIWKLVFICLWVCIYIYIYIYVCVCMQESDLSLHLWDALSHTHENLYVYFCEYKLNMYMYATIRFIHTSARRSHAHIRKLVFVCLWVCIYIYMYMCARVKFSNTYVRRSRAYI